MSRAQEEKYIENPPPTEVALQNWFHNRKKDGKKIGMARYLTVQPYRIVEIGHWLLPEEKGKGYGTEVAQMLVDYLFLSKDVGRVQATTHLENLVSQKVLERVGFKKEGIMRRTIFIKGNWADQILYSILREKWKEPKILTTVEI